MTNTNCLKGFACPDCGSEEGFYIEARVEVLVRDDGTEDQGGEYMRDDDHACRCADCDHQGLVMDFDIENQTAPAPASI
jgi:hypothetical protein